MKLILASSSPRRKQLLAQLGYDFDQVSLPVDESLLPDEAVDDYLLRVSLLKAQAVKQRFESEKNTVILACDTVVCCDGDILQKPQDQNHFQQIMRRLSASQHTVKSAVVLLSDNSVKHIVCKTAVKFRRINDEEITAYWHTNEPLDKAGGYAIQGIGAGFVESIEGSYSNVVGLPLTQTIELLRCFDIDYLGN